MNSNLHRSEAEKVIITPEMAMKMLDFNKVNRPLNQSHVNRLKREIEQGRWRLNGDTIKVSDTEDILDGQHRLWACVESQISIETYVVRGINKDAFATIDTLRKPRSGADVLSVNGVEVNRSVMASALAWLIRYERACILEHRQPKNRVENAHIEEAFRKHPGMIRAVEHTHRLRAVGNHGIIAAFFYLISSQDPFLAERMVTTLENPQHAGVDDPFFRLRSYLTADRLRATDPVVTCAMIIKAANAASAGGPCKVLRYFNHGTHPENFPILKIKPVR